MCIFLHAHCVSNDFADSSTVSSSSFFGGTRISASFIATHLSTAAISTRVPSDAPRYQSQHGLDVHLA